MALLEEYNYQTLMRNSYGDATLAKKSMEKSFRINWAHRDKYIPRKRCKSAIRILRVLKERLSREG